MQNLEIFVAAHKLAPKYGDDCYKFIHVGAKTSKILIPDAINDDVCEDNISEKNNIYCELTGLYHVWKNVRNVKYVGLCHYRRLPSVDTLFGKKRVMTGEEILDILQKVDIILPKQARKRGVVNGFFAKGDESINNYRPYKLMLPVIKELFPEYENDFKKEFHTEYMSFGNIMVCSKKIFDDYCSWLFSILFKVEDNIMTSGDKVEPRELGFYSEWLLNIWVRHQHLNVKFVPLFLPEKKSIMAKLMRL